MQKYSLHHLISACLLGDSDLVDFQNELKLYAYIDKVKFKYLERYIVKNTLNNFVQLIKNKNQIIISHQSLGEYYRTWYKNSKKIFSQRITPYLLEYESIILYIILFGKRQVEGIRIDSNIDKDHLVITTFCVQSHLQTYLNFGDSFIKILDVINFIKKNQEKIKLQELVELFQYLTTSEMNKVNSILA